MKRPAWLDEREPSLRRQIALAPLRAASWCYGAGARAHRAAYALGFAPRAKLACKVVSVGSLVVGGSGKTPLAAWIAAQLHARGRRVALATRGYGGTPHEPVHVASDGRHAQEAPSVVGDEALLLAQLAPGVPVLVARERALAGQLAIDRFGAEVAVTVVPAPELAEQVERGDIDGPRTRELIAAYVRTVRESGADVLALGCTHYAFLRRLIEEEAGEGIAVIEPSDAVARQVQRTLEREGMLAASGAAGEVVYLTSGDRDELERVLECLRASGADLPGAQPLAAAKGGA